MIAVVDDQRRIVVMDEHGEIHRRLFDDALLWGSWAQHSDPDVHSWPAWSPDGTRIAAFRIARDGHFSRVWVTDLQGEASAEVAAMGNRVPIYLQWSLEGTRLAVLSQDDQQLVLQQADPDGAQEDLELLRGSPLFFTWLPGEQIAAFVGEGPPEQPTMTVLGSDHSRRELPGSPGNFCAPVRLARGVAYVAHRHDRIVIMTASSDGARIAELEEVIGLVAVIASPDGKRLARAMSPDGTGSPYRDLSVLDVDTAEVTPLTDMPCEAFLWLPDGAGLVVASRNDRSKEVTWTRVALDGTTEELIQLVPTRDTRVYLRFFEQYSPSHPIVDPAGRWLLVCGTRPGSADSPPRVWRVPLDGGDPEDLGQGLFATFPPPAPPE